MKTLTAYIDVDDEIEDDDGADAIGQELELDDEQEQEGDILLIEHFIDWPEYHIDINTESLVIRN